ncbi:hypothetical protein Q9L58_002871 [Maublancomyces gigas]|uniref:THUMP domain-containing protein n=1 Tax=Discina gigas TaxID=1032678 RepID=A0ABR3GQ78_9PEZI
MVHTILEDKTQSKWTHRLTPVTRTGKATLEGLEVVAKEVLKPYFHEGQEGVKFCIRPTTRQHNVLDRDQVIKVVADIVGPKHKVDINNHDVLILVDIYKNMCGMSVVRDFEKLKRYNLSEILKDERASKAAAEGDKKSQEVSK